MSINAKDIIGLKIITVSDGAQIETVDDVVYDPLTQRITALLVNKGGFFSKPHAIAIEEVSSIGKDAVIVESKNVIKSVEDLGEGVKDVTSHAFNLVKTDIITQDGTQLGKVSDLVFDATTGNVEELIVTQGGIKTVTSGKKRVKPADIVTIGADATIVSNYIEEEFSEQAEQGGLQGALSTAQEKLSDVKDTVTEKAQGAIEKVKEIPENPTVQEKLASAKEGVSDMTDKARDAGSTVVDKVQEKKDDIQNKSDSDSNESTAHAPTTTFTPTTPTPVPNTNPAISETFVTDQSDKPFDQPAEANLNSAIDDTHPVTDSANNIDSQQLYDEGLANSVEAQEPNSNSAVTDYDPEKDKRKV